MPSFLIVVLLAALAAVVVMLVVRSRTQAQPRRSTQRANREAAEGVTRTSPAAVSAGGDTVARSTDDAPRMPMGDLPRRSHRRQ